jgi:hypothetical protein
MIFDLFSLIFLVLCDDRESAEFHHDFRSLLFVIFGSLRRTGIGGVSS